MSETDLSATRGAHYQLDGCWPTDWTRRIVGIVERKTGPILRARFRVSADDMYEILQRSARPQVDFIHTPKLKLEIQKNRTQKTEHQNHNM